MSKQVLTDEQVNDLQELLNSAALGIDNLFTGMHDNPTGMYEAQECFTRQDMKTTAKALDTLRRLANNFDGTRKQRKRGHNA